MPTDKTNNPPFGGLFIWLLFLLCFEGGLELNLGLILGSYKRVVRGLKAEV